MPAPPHGNRRPRQDRRPLRPSRPARTRGPGSRLRRAWPWAGRSLGRPGPDRQQRQARAHAREDEAPPCWGQAWRAERGRAWTFLQNALLPRETAGAQGPCPCSPASGGAGAGQPRRRLSPGSGSQALRRPPPRRWLERPKAWASLVEGCWGHPASATGASAHGRPRALPGYWPLGARRLSSRPRPLHLLLVSCAERRWAGGQPAGGRAGPHWASVAGQWRTEPRASPGTSGGRVGSACPCTSLHGAVRSCQTLLTRASTEGTAMGPVSLSKGLSRLT